MQLRINLNVACQVHIVEEKGFYKTWTFDFSNPQYRGEMVYQTMHCLNIIFQQGIDTEISGVDNEKSNVRESPISRDTLIITDAKYGVKRRVPKILLGCSCNSCKMSSSLNQMMEVYLDPDMPIQMV